jgi:hypothetical protein
MVVSQMNPLAAAVRKYIHEVIGVTSSEDKVWAQENELPYYLKEAFEFREMELMGQPIVLAMKRSQDKQSLSEVKTWLNKVRAVAGKPAVYVTEALASYERKRLIEQKVPFVVPGNQLYLPDCGLDFREYFRKRAEPADSPLSPSAQAMLITALLHQPWETQWQPAKVATALGYTPMTLSRAVKELTSSGIATARTVGRTRWLGMEKPAQQLWELAQPLMRSPVKRSVWVLPESSAALGVERAAGLSALAKHTMLAEPKWPVYAMDGANWKKVIAAGVRELPEPVPGAQEWQLWSYSPALVQGSDMVDPLSLILSLQDSADDRVQLALDELKGQLPW